MSTEASNPLFTSQREKSGATTFSKYAYQYHWALFRVIKEHADGNEYAVFMEVHEDVVISNSLDDSKALFEFNQVKTNKGAFNAQKLVKLKNGSSVLGKLVSNSDGKPFSSKLSSLNLVSVNGFSLPLKKDGIHLTKIAIADIHEDTTKELSAAIKDELSIDPLPTNLYFIVPDFPASKFQDLIIAEISKLIRQLFPGSYYDSVEVYRVLYDDITRKGMITYDIKEWQEFLKTKALTSETVAQVITQFTNLKDEATIVAQFGNIVREIGLNSIQAKNLEKLFNRYRQNRVANKSTLQLDISKELSAHLQDALQNSIDDWADIFSFIESKLSDKVRKYFTDANALKTAIIYEFIIQK